VATGLGTGTTTITATNSADTSKTATATVTVRDWILDEDSSGGINLLDATGVNQPVPLLPAFTCQVPAFFADRQSFACSNGGEILIYATDGTAKGTVQKYAINTGLYSVTDVSASPDGTHVVYHAVVLGSGTSSYDNVYTNTLDGQNQQLLSSDLTSTVGPTTPWWSPDGTTILWVRIESGAPYVWTMKATDGSNKARLFNTPSAASIWSADGTKIFYDHFADEEIWSRSANGSDSSEKLLAGGKVGQPYPSADNERFAYWANGSIVIANASTGGIITTLPINSDVLSW
jgi:Tol biopolymer transport system component